MFDIAGQADDRGLAVDQRGVRQYSQGLLHQHFPEVGPHGDKIGKIVRRFPCERIADHRAGCRPCNRPHRWQSALAVNRVADNEQPADVHAYLPVRR